MELTLIFSLFGAVALTLLVPAIRGMFAADAASAFRRDPPSTFG